MVKVDPLVLNITFVLAFSGKAGVTTFFLARITIVVMLVIVPSVRLATESVDVISTTLRGIAFFSYRGHGLPRCVAQDSLVVVSATDNMQSIESKT